MSCNGIATMFLGQHYNFQIIVLTLWMSGVYSICMIKYDSVKLFLIWSRFRQPWFAFNEADMVNSRDTVIIDLKNKTQTQKVIFIMYNFNVQQSYQLIFDL